MRNVTWPVALTMVVTLVATMAGAVPPRPAQAEPWQPPAVAEIPGVAVEEVRAAPPVTWTADSRVRSGHRPATWPATGTFTVNLDAAGSGPTLDGHRGDLPIRVVAQPAHRSALAEHPTAGGPVGGLATVRVHDRAAAAAAGIDGLLFSLNRAQAQPGASPVAVQVHYRGFAPAYGGDWASRLRLVQLPGCALTTPRRPQCQTVTPLRTSNDLRASRLAADVSLPEGPAAVLLAVEAGPSGDNGDYTATPLTQASTWNVGLQSGDFSWSYPLRVPPGPGGPAPALALGYSSGSLDGRTGASNNQGGWVGDGFDAWSGFIERRYVSCADDNPSRKTGDLCWRTDNATLSMSGRAGELVETATAGVWRLRNDDGTRVERLTDPTRDNGDDNDEYWKVTTTDGMQLFFGQHRLPGWQTGQPVTGSVWTVPVYGNHSGEPCHDSTFADAWCPQAWRWNLDYVVDPHGNSLAYFYQQETGWYGRNLSPASRTGYTRGGWLDRIEYGMRQGSEYAQAAPVRVSFGTAERCLSDCWEGSAWASDPVGEAWPDTPWDQHCAESPCTDQLWPTFWSARRLVTVTTQLRSGPAGYRDVESWTLRHEFLDAGDNEGSPMWLRGITRTGHVTTAGGQPASDPEVVFDPGANPLPNRVDGPSDGRSSLTRFRVRTITLESGGQINISYSAPDCTRASLPTPHTNAQRCIPGYYSPAGEPTLDWFHKYVVTRVDLHDPIADGTTAPANPDQTTFYDYLDAPAWHYTDDELTKAEYRTWAGWRGYARVRVRTGTESGRQTAVEHRFLRGMHGDKLPSGTRDVQVTDSWGGSIQDDDAFHGFELQQISFDGPGGAEVGSTVTTPVKLGPTATRTSGGITVQAWIVRPGTERSRTALETGGFRTIATITQYNPDGLVTSVSEDGDESRTGDETCERTTYARNDGGWMIDRVSQLEVLSMPCVDVETPTATTVLSRSRSFYDSYTGEGSFGDPPTRGNLVRTEELEDWDGSTPVYTRTASTAYDERGRPIAETDLRGHTTATAYTTVEGGLVAAVAVTNPLDHTVTIVKEPAWDQPTRSTDANGVVTELSYDGLGRLTNVWLPGRLRTQPPSLKYAYLMRSGGGPTAVTSQTLLHTGVAYRKSVALFDGFLRERQQQAQASGGGRTIVDTLHDAMGNVASTTAPYYDQTNGTVSTELATTDGQVPARSRFEHDGAGRKTAEILESHGVEKWRTTTAYGGDRTHLTPPAGATATTTVTDARGHTTALHQYRSPQDVGDDDPATFVRTSYTHTLLGQLEAVTDQAGNVWRYHYDLRGRQTRTDHPDRGTTEATYDAAGNPQTVTTPLGTATATVAFTYDALNRRTSMRDDTVTGPMRAEWRYDQTPMVPDGTKVAKGLPTAAIRYVGTDAYTRRVDAYDQYGRSISSSVVLPASQSSLCAAGGPDPCIYPTTASYRPNGARNTTTLPAAADLPSERLSHGYSDLGLPGSLHSPEQVYVGAVSYNKLDQLASRAFGPEGARVAVVSEFDEPTRRLVGTVVMPESRPEVARYRYAYDDAGNITSLSDAPDGAAADHQCFTYDQLRRLTEAWTPGTGDCATAPSDPGLGGPAPYWQEWEIDDLGNRQTEVRHAPAGDTTYSYTYPAAGAESVRPHAVTSVTASGARAWSRGYTYDDGGNTRSRPTSTGGTQTLTHDPEGHLDHLVEDGDQTSYLYDADGRRLIRTDPDGSKTLYLGTTEVRSSGTGSTATRYYQHAGTTIGVRTSGGLHWIVGDHHGTAQLTINAADLTAAKRRTLPYGEPRGTTSGTWPTGLDKGFLGGTNDPSELTHLGAREYDPFLGRFTSLDPVVDPANPQQINGYAYGNSRPTTVSDPTGLYPACDSEGNRECKPSPSPSKDPSQTVEVDRILRYSGGTVAVRLTDGTVIVNGYVIRSGVKDLEALASRLDQRISRDSYEDPRALLWATIAEIAWSACNPEICTLEVYEKANVDNWKLRESGLAHRKLTWGPCVGAGGGWGGGGFGVTACLAYGKDGLSLVLSMSGAAGPSKGGPSGGLGGYAGVGLTGSNGTAQDQAGPGGVGGGSVAGYGVALAYEHNFSMGYETQTHTVLVGVGSGWTADGGTGFTCVIAITSSYSGCGYPG